jgi:hypothetical protein
VIETFPALLIIVVAVLPGALYSWGFEQAAGAWRTGAADRTLRFVGGSAAFHALAAPLTWWVVTRQMRTSLLTRPTFWWPLWLLALGLVVIPTAAGRVTGAAVRRRHPWAGWLVGGTAPPRAWDHVFVEGRAAWLRIRLKDAQAGAGGWIVGHFASSTSGAPGSYVGGGESPDLYIVDTAEVDPADGRVVPDQDGRPRMRGSGVLLRYDEVLYMEVSWE